MSKTELKHIGFIMDGNGRWAQARGMKRTEGHKQGSKALENIIKVLKKDDILEQVSIYCFSTENWARPIAEVKAIMDILKNFMINDVQKLMEDGVAVNILGDLSEGSPFTDDLREMMLDVNERSVKNPALKINLCINYGGREEIVRATNNLITKNIEVTEDSLTKEILNGDLPLDLVVRTSGEQRLSNFLLWQSAYAELLFVGYHWPDMNAEKYDEIKDLYYKRDRRFGKIQELA
ncbi:MAG: di-trans,poly-cis-decaprenylcistransferase [Proteobacteria bacterium]|nr:di-trans,poly-cis-decaprenylcistransferase [Pseudomonadota bacterium]